jgi:hypothetical protein
VKIKLVKRYSIHNPGRVVDCEDAIAERLLEDGTAVREPMPEEIETASLEPVAERADITPRRKRGRPRNAIPKPEAADVAGD